MIPVRTGTIVQNRGVFQIEFIVITASENVGTFHPARVLATNVVFVQVRMRLEIMIILTANVDRHTVNTAAPPVHLCWVRQAVHICEYEPRPNVMEYAAVRMSPTVRNTAELMRIERISQLCWHNEEYVRIKYSDGAFLFGNNIFPGPTERIGVRHIDIRIEAGVIEQRATELDALATVDEVFILLNINYRGSYLASSRMNSIVVGATSRIEQGVIEHDESEVLSQMPTEGIVLEPNEVCAMRAKCEYLNHGRSSFAAKRLRTSCGPMITSAELNSRSRPGVPLNSLRTDAIT